MYTESSFQNSAMQQRDYNYHYIFVFCKNICLRLSKLYFCFVKSLPEAGGDRNGILSMLSGQTRLSGHAQWSRGDLCTAYKICIRMLPIKGFEVYDQNFQN